MEALRLPYSPQLSATGYGRSPYVDETASIEAQASLLPQMYAQKAQEDYFTEQTRIANEERKRMVRDSNIALGIKGTELGYQAFKNPTLQRYGKSVLDALKPKPWQGPATNLAPVDYLHASPAPIDTSVPLGMPLVPDPVAAPMMTPTATVTTSAGTTAAPVMGTSGFSGILPTLGGEGLASSAGNFAIKAGVPALVNAGISRAIIGKKATGSEQAVSDVATSLSSFVLGGPIGLGANLLGIGAREFGKKNCIIVTVACGIDSEEVRIAKEFRDKECSRNELRGYYYFGDMIVPLMEAHEDVKEFVKSTLVDPLIAYARWYLGYVKEKPCAMAFSVVKNFRQSCLDAGSTMKSYTRANGEEV